MLNFKTSRPVTSRADVLLHAVSHYALVHNAVNVGNYEARVEYFPVQFRTDRLLLPSMAAIEHSPWKIDWDRYQKIEYLVAWKMVKEEKDNIEVFFNLVFKEQNLTIWIRK